MPSHRPAVAPGNVARLKPPARRARPPFHLLTRSGVASDQPGMPSGSNRRFSAADSPLLRSSGTVLVATMPPTDGLEPTSAGGCSGCSANRSFASSSCHPAVLPEGAFHRLYRFKARAMIRPANR